MSKWILLLLILASQSGCESRKAGAIGGDDQIIVFADSSDWFICLPALQQAFERTFLTPQPEKEFYIQLVPISVFETYKKYKNVVFVGSLESTGPVAQTVQSMLGAEVKPGVQSGEYFLFTRDDEWARGQKLMILTATGTPILASTIHEHGEELFRIFDEHKTALNYEILFGQNSPLEDKNLQTMLHLKYGWTMRIHADLKLVDESSDRSYVRFHAFSRHSALQRWISVLWIPTTSPDSLLNREAMIRLRNQIGASFVDPTVTVPEYDAFGISIAAGYAAHSYRGVWRTTTPKNAFGGAFRTYAFFDSVQSRVYFIDQAVFYPEEKKKLQFLRELDIITHTFTTKAP